MPPQDNETRNASKRAHYYRRIAKGLCIKCVRPSTVGVLCDYHREKTKMKSREYREAYSKNPSICNRCGKDMSYMLDIDPDRRTCVNCSEKVLENLRWR